MQAFIISLLLCCQVVKQAEKDEKHLLAHAPPNNHSRDPTEQSQHVMSSYLVELNALLRHPGCRVLETENSQLCLDQVGGILLHRGHIKLESAEVRIGLCVGDDV